jgi:hypothetical protein
MQALFWQDFSAVRVHTDTAAAADAAALSARAFTDGVHVRFGAGQWQPDTSEGRRLLAHELAHVVQSGGRSAAQPHGVDSSGGHAEAEAEAHRASVLAGLGLPTGRIRAPLSTVALTPVSNQVTPLISYSATDWEVTAAEEQQVVALLRADPNLSTTIIDLNAAGMLRAMLERIDEPANRRDLLRLLGAGLNAAARAVVEPIIQDLNASAGATQGAQIQYNLGRLGVSGGAAPFNRASYNDLIGGSMTAFTGSGATGVNPSDRGYIDWARAGTSAFDDHINPVGSLSRYLSSLTPAQRRRQVELLVNQPISTNFGDSYAGQLPSRLQVIRAVAAAHRLEPELVTAIILAEQRDQSLVEDARDFIGALVFSRNTSIGLGQVTGSTAQRHDLFADMLTEQPSPFAATTARHSANNPAQMAWLLSSDETNIAAVARYARILADDGSRRSIAALPRTQAAFPGIDLPAYANPSSAWPEDNIGALGMYYTSRAWTDDVRSAAWGWFVQQAYQDVKAARVF